MGCSEENNRVVVALSHPLLTDKPEGPLRA
jgi:hypothetical protein